MPGEEKNIASMGKVERVDFSAQSNGQAQQGGGEQLSAEEQANVDNGLNKDGSPKTTELSAEQKQANIDAGLNEDGSAKELSQTEKDANVAKGLNPDGTQKVELSADQKLDNLAKGLNEDGTTRTEPLSKEQIEALHKREFPQQAEPTEEEKKKKAEAFEKRMLDFYVDNGGTVDQFALMKQVASADLTELSEKELEAELKKAGFSEEQKVLIRKERYYQLEDEAIESLEDPDEKEFAKKKKDFGTQKLQGKAAYKQKLAVGFFDSLKKAVEEQDAEAATEVQLAQKVDSIFDKMPRKMTLQLGKTKDNEDIAPIEIVISDTAIAEARESLKNADKRNKLLYNEDGSVNLTELSNLMLRNKILEAALNESYLTGVSRNTAEFEKRFPFREQNALGAVKLSGGSNQEKVKGKIASFGKTEKVAQV